MEEFALARAHTHYHQGRANSESVKGIRARLCNSECIADVKPREPIRVCRSDSTQIPASTPLFPIPSSIFSVRSLFLKHGALQLSINKIYPSFTKFIYPLRFIICKTVKVLLLFITCCSLISFPFSLIPSVFLGRI